MSASRASIVCCRLAIAICLFSIHFEPHTARHAVAILYTHTQCRPSAHRAAATASRRRVKAIRSGRRSESEVRAKRARGASEVFQWRGVQCRSLSLPMAFHSRLSHFARTRNYKSPTRPAIAHDRNSGPSAHLNPVRTKSSGESETACNARHFLLLFNRRMFHTSLLTAEDAADAEDAAGRNVRLLFADHR